MLATITNNTDWGFVLSLVGVILSVVVLIQSKFTHILAIGCAIGFFAGVLVWWP